MSYSSPDDDNFIRPGGAGSNAIRDADKALFPDGSNLIHILMKARLNQVVKPQADHILAMAIRRGRLDTSLKVNGKSLNAGEAHYIADAINSFGANGYGRDEMIDVFAALPTMERRNSGGRGHSAAGDLA